MIRNEAVHPALAHESEKLGLVLLDMHRTVDALSKLIFGERPSSLQ